MFPKKKIKKIKTLFLGAGIVAVCAVLFGYGFVKFFPQNMEKLLSLVGYKNLSVAKAQAQVIIQTCVANKTAHCYDSELAKLAEATDMQNAIGVLRALQAVKPALKNCHLIAHKIAEAAAVKEPSKWRELISAVDVSECGGGFLHGILGVHIGYDQNFVINTASIQDVCNNFAGDKIVNGRSKAMACTHFMGHLKLVETDGDVDRALLACKDFSGRFAIECNNGVFMEDTYQLALFDHGLVDALPPQDEAHMIHQKTRCGKYSGPQGISCWIDLGEVFAEFYNFDPSKTFAACEAASSLDERSQCYGKAAVVMLSASYFDDPAKISSVCAPLAGSSVRAIKECLHSAIVGATIYKFNSRAATLCALTEAPYQNYCFRELGRQFTSLGRSTAEKTAVCNLFPQFSDVCLGGF